MSWYPKPTRAIETEAGIKARSKRGDFAEKWWAQRWIQALERITDAGRLRRGSTYARKGQVLSVEEKAGAIQARVQGSRATPYKIRIRLQPLTAVEWEAVIEKLGEQAIFTAQLLAGEMPQDIEEAFAQAGVSLFPDKSAELETDCSCPDWANPCKHVAAAHYILGEQFDEDPFLLFRLRGMDQARLFDALRARRTEPTLLAEEPEAYITGEQVTPLEESLDNFWRLGVPLDHFPTAIRQPTTPLPVLRRLGQPSFVEQNLESVLGSLYETATHQALLAAFQNQEAQTSSEDAE